MTRVSLSKPLFAVALAVLVGIVTASAREPATQADVVSGAKGSAFGAFWQVGDGYSSTLVLRNSDHQNTTSVQVSLFGSAGQQVGATQIQLAHDATNRLDLSSLTGAEGGFGGVVLAFTGQGMPQVAGKIEISDAQSGASIDLPVQGGYRYDTENTVYAPWWMPDDGTEGRIALFNATLQKIVVWPSVGMKGTETAASKLVLAPHESKMVTLSELGANEQQGVVILRYSGPPHALQPTALLQNRSTRFWLASAFNGKHVQSSTQSASWQFPDIRIGTGAQNSQSANSDESNPETYALLTNGTGSRMVPQLMAYYGLRGQPTKTAIPTSALAPLESRLIDLSDSVRTGVIPASVFQLALGVTYSGQPGDMAIEIFSVDRVTGQVSEPAGTVLPPGLQDASYWNVANNVCLLPTVRNKGSVTTTGQVAAYYSTPLGVGSYVLPEESLAAGKTTTLPLKHDLQAGIPDQYGETAAPGAASGILTLSAVNSSGSTPSASAVAAKCATLETCAVPNSSQAAVGSTGLALEAPSSCGPPTQDAPTITSISPTGTPFSSKTQVTINGDNLDDPGITVNITGGIQATINSTSATQLVATFDTGGDTTVGTQDLFLSSDYGYSNSEDFEVDDNQPTGITVTSPWPAGSTNYPVTITGSYFGTNPTVVLSDVTGNPASDATFTKLATGCCTDSGQAGGAKIQGTVTVNPCANPGSVTVQVTSTGYNGSGFIGASQGISPNGTGTAQVTPLSAITPTISGPQSPIVAGQKITLTGNIPSPQSSCLASQSWTVPTGTSAAIANYTPTPSSYATGSVKEMAAGSTSTYVFYPVNDGTLTTTFKYALSNGQPPSDAATITYTVNGPTGGDITVNHVGTMSIQTINGGPSLMFGTLIAPNTGVLFSPKATAPSGYSNTFEWVNLVTDNTITIDGTVCTSKVPQTGLDTHYPTPFLKGTNEFADSPALPLDPAETEDQRSTSMKTYLLWTSNLADSIYVPLGSITWTFSGTAKNSGTPTAPVWKVTAGSGSAGSFASSTYTAPDYGYPTWGNVASASCDNM